MRQDSAARRLVRDVMQPAGVWRMRDSSLRQAATVLTETRSAGLPCAIGAGAFSACSARDRATSLMALEGVHRLLVLDAQSRLAGIIASMDVLRELAGFGRRATRRVIAVALPAHDAAGSGGKR